MQNQVLASETSCDHECLRLISTRGLVSRLVDTSLYHQLVQMVLEEEESVGKMVVEQLFQGGHKPQAQTLQVENKYAISSYVDIIFF